MGGKEQHHASRPSFTKLRFDHPRSEGHASLGQRLDVHMQLARALHATLTPLTYCIFIPLLNSRT